MIRIFLLNIFFFIPVWLLKLVYWKRRTPIRGRLLDIQSSIILDLIPKSELHKVSDNSIQKVRDLIIKQRTRYQLSLAPNSAVGKIDHFIEDKDTLLLREYIPKNIEKNKVVLFFHGGGYVLSSVETHDAMVSFIADNLGVKIFSLDYSLAPENKYPSALNEALAAYNWLISMGYNSNQISLCGDSAGGHLAASLTHHLITNNHPEPHSQLLIYPMCDPSCSSESFTLFEENYLLTKKAMIWFWDKLMYSNDNMDDECFNLMKVNLKKELPKTIVVTAGFDPLSDEAEKYAYLLHEKGNNVKQLHYPSTFHGFASMTRLNSAKIAVVDFLREYKEIL
jgi:acetyl esterase